MAFALKLFNMPSWISGGHPYTIKDMDPTTANTDTKSIPHLIWHLRHLRYLNLLGYLTYWSKPYPSLLSLCTPQTICLDSKHKTKVVLFTSARCSSWQSCLSGVIQTAWVSTDRHLNIPLPSALPQWWKLVIQKKRENAFTRLCQVIFHKYPWMQYKRRANLL